MTSAAAARQRRYRLRKQAGRKPFVIEADPAEPAATLVAAELLRPEDATDQTGSVTPFSTRWTCGLSGRSSDSRDAGAGEGC